MRFLSVSGTALAGFLLLSAPAAMAQTADQAQQPSSASRPSDTQAQSKTPAGLTGDWGGARTDLHNTGIDLSLGYSNEFGANVAGGKREDATDVGQVAFGLTVDTGKLVHLNGGTFQTSITFRHGLSLDQNAGTGTLQQTQEVYGRGQTWRLTELWYQQKIGDAVDVKVGRLTMGNEFASFTCDFQNLTFCGAPSGNLVGDYWFNWPIAQWGGRVRFKRPDWYVMAGVFEWNPNNLRNKFALSFPGARGVTAPAEFGWTPRLGPKGLPGTYKVGVWYNTDHGNDLLLDTTYHAAAVTGLEPLQRDGRYGGYIMIQQQLTGTYAVDPATGPHATHGLSIFVNFTQADRATARTDNQIAAGLVFAGPLAFRRNDDVGFALGRTNVNARAALAELLATPGSPRANAEYAGELYYSLHLVPGLIVRPNVQYVLHPGGYETAHDVVVIGTKTAITF